MRRKKNSDDKYNPYLFPVQCNSWYRINIEGKEPAMAQIRAYGERGQYAVVCYYDGRIVCTGTRNECCAYIQKWREK